MRPFSPTTGRQNQMLHCAISLNDPNTTPKQFRRISNVFQPITAHILIGRVAQFCRGSGSTPRGSFPRTTPCDQGQRQSPGRGVLLKACSDRACAEGYAPPSCRTIITSQEWVGALQKHKEASRGVRGGNCKACFRASFPVVRHAVGLRNVMRSTAREVLAIGGPYGHDDTLDRSFSPSEET